MEPNNISLQNLTLSLGDKEPFHFHDYQTGDISWIMTCSAMVFLMAPGIGLFYSGLGKSKNSLSLIMLSMASCAVISVQWLLVGYTLTFSKTGNWFIGTFENIFYFHLWNEPSLLNPAIPDLLFSIYQGMFAMVTPSIIIGSGAGRARLLPTIIFMILWSTFVYDFVAYWVWNPNGWANVLGSLDFAGGSPVHIASGAASLAFAICLGRKKDIVVGEPENILNVVLGTVLIWFGWFGFNGGSALASGTRAALAFLVTNLAASAGAITSVLIEARGTKQFSTVAFCSGAIVGMVAITPASGYVSPMSSLFFGASASLICHGLIRIKHFIPIDDTTDVFIAHGIAGLWGNLLTGVFAQSSIASLDGTVINGGWIDGNWIQVCYQLAGSFASMAWSFVVSLIILKIIDKIPGCKLNAGEAIELEGVDKTDLGGTIIQTMSKEC